MKVTRARHKGAWIAAALFFLSAALGPPAAAAGDPPELQKLLRLEGARESAVLGELRDRAQRDAALMSSIQAGTRWRYREILEKEVLPLSRRLDALFDFRPLLIREGNLLIVPPVVAEAGFALRVEDGQKKASTQEKSYLLVSKAKIASVPPNWRSYLLADLGGDAETHPSLWPVGAGEKRAWAQRIRKGFALGAEQGDLLFASRLAELKRDYLGLWLYRELYGAKLLSPPEAQSDREEISVGERSLIYGLTLYDLLRDGSFLPSESPRPRQKKGR
ncbi:MAG: type IV secretory system conjugative DNA transfer family protein [Deltaproteobacteria bacterium]|jgi:defect-in-organelle-trafficking protein DotC|nr:type IV secretory system conjugative DNA transfer family protein [Deltaproteobacteria bacterium]